MKYTLEWIWSKMVLNASLDLLRTHFHKINLKLLNKFQFKSFEMICNHSFQVFSSWIHSQATGNCGTDRLKRLTQYIHHFTVNTDENNNKIHCAEVLKLDKIMFPLLNVDSLHKQHRRAAWFPLTSYPESVNRQLTDKCIRIHTILYFPKHKCTTHVPFNSEFSPLFLTLLFKRYYNIVELL